MTTPRVPQLNDDDIELLSSYLDNQVTDAERRDLEARLEREPRLRLALDELRATVRLLADLPALPPPRSFTIDPASVRPRWYALAPLFRMGSAVAALLLALTFTAEFIGRGAGGGGMAESTGGAPQAPATRMFEETAGEGAATAAPAVAMPFAAAPAEATAAAAVDAAQEAAPAAATEAPAVDALMAEATTATDGPLPESPLPPTAGDIITDAEPSSGEMTPVDSPAGGNAGVATLATPPPLPTLRADDTANRAVVPTAAPAQEQADLAAAQQATTEADALSNATSEPAGAALEQSESSSPGTVDLQQQPPVQPSPARVEPFRIFQIGLALLALAFGAAAFVIARRS